MFAYRNLKLGVLLLFCPTSQGIAVKGDVIVEMTEYVQGQWISSLSIKAHIMSKNSQKG